MSGFIDSIGRHNTFSPFRLVERYDHHPTIGNNLLARTSFVCSGIFSLIETVCAVALAIFSGVLTLATFGILPSLRRLTMELIRISTYNSMLFTASLVGAVIHPLLGITCFENGATCCLRLFRK
jgi:hypothetical protein